MTDFDLFIIGGGSGGVRCARVAAGHGARVAVAERRFWGGTCVNVGCIPKKLMVQGAEYGAACADARRFGWQASSGAHDWGGMMRSITTEVTRLSGLYRAMLETAGVAVFETEARIIDPHTVEVGGRRITAETLVIATGGQPVRPRMSGAGLGGLSDDVFALTELPRRVVILGGGYIAVEFAGILAGLGAEVDLVYRQPFPLRGFDDDLREMLAGALESQGISLHPARTLASLERQGSALLATCNDGRRLLADFVLFATGRRAATDGLGLAALGIELARDGGIVVDCDRRTAVGNIYAIGDAVDHVNLTPVALAHGHILAERLFGDGTRGWNFDQVPTAVFSRPPLATVGPSEQEAARHGLVDVYITSFTPLKHRMTGRTAHQSCMKLVVDAATQRVLGAHMMGDDAPEIIQGLAIAITARATKSDLDQTLGIHPTSAEEFVTLRTRTRQSGISLL